MAAGGVRNEAPVLLKAASTTPGPKAVGPSAAPGASGPAKAAVTSGAPKAGSDTIVQPARIAPFKIVSIEQANQYIKALVYAEYGVGKTFLMGTSADVPSMRDVLLISAEGGQLTLEDDEHDFNLIDVVQVRDYKTVAKVHEFLKLHCTLRDRAFAGDEAAKEKMREIQQALMPDIKDPNRIRMYQTVITDSLTEIEVYCMNQLLGVSDSTKIDEETQGAEWAEYKKQHMMVQRLIRNFRDLPMNVLFSCARAYVQDDQKRQLFSPMMTGKLAGQVQGFMDMVGYLVLAKGDADADESQHITRMYVRAGTRFAAKSRFSRYKKPYFDNPTMGSIMVDVGLLEPADVPRLKAKPAGSNSFKAGASKK